MATDCIYNHDGECKKFMGHCINGCRNFELFKITRGKGINKNYYDLIIRNSPNPDGYVLNRTELEILYKMMGDAL